MIAICMALAPHSNPSLRSCDSHGAADYHLPLFGAHYTFRICTIFDMISGCCNDLQLGVLYTGGARVNLQYFKT